MSSMRFLRLHLLHLVRTSLPICAALLASASLATAAPSGLVSKQQQVEALEAQVSALEERYGGLQERFRGAQVEQRRLNQTSLKATQELERTRAELVAARERLMNRVVALYQDSSSSPLVELAVAGSISEAFDRVEAANRISQSDAEYVDSVIKLERRVKKQERAVRTARDSHAKLTRRMASDSRQMQRLLVERRGALASANAEVRIQMERDRRAAAVATTAASRERVAQLQGGGSAVEPSSSGSTQSSPSAESVPPSPESSAASDQPESSVSVPLPPSSGSAARAAQIAMGKVGAPYVWAAAGPDSFDCSGLVVWAFAQAGRPGLPHSTYSLITMGVEVPLSQAQVGDLVFTNSTGHMGIYVGGGQMVHSPRTGRTVSVEPLTYYSVTAVRRI
jgi:cell wall-associated NlpC family hydrolase